MSEPAHSLPHLALGRLPSGIYILTVGEDATATGMLASWVQQAAFEPPMLSVALKRGRPVCERIEAGESFVLNVVGEGQKSLLKHFAKGFEPDEPAFEGVAIARTACGAPALADAIAVLECRMATVADAGDHRVVIAEVTASEVLTDTPPIVHLRKRGDHY
ncbi:flavin reductase family protein [Botrimarina mediterranea]|uniref:Diflavin flavoprotein A 3 n=1 Tax=Botrimarina mediterranea TaxID=2528022 RepID=A0A518K432_9BACT|nr:flavin reductase family protein [Botrimarina mediterranea]QDV72556.1 Putative diflavin flavoprotein A 3 [Botrimarina mediterranea]QDV77128.1 Putative diflavin flavoprotein A 3 [Planctomycetes bacterium K2D]